MMSQILIPEYSAEAVTRASAKAKLTEGGIFGFVVGEGAKFTESKNGNPMFVLPLIPLKDSGNLNSGMPSYKATQWVVLPKSSGEAGSDAEKKAEAIGLERLYGTLGALLPDRVLAKPKTVREGAGFVTYFKGEVIERDQIQAATRQAVQSAIDTAKWLAEELTKGNDVLKGAFCIGKVGYDKNSSFDGAKVTFYRELPFKAEFIDPSEVLSR